MAQAASDQRARDRHRCVLPAALPARDAQRQSWLAQVAPLPRLRDVRTRVMAACQALPKGAGGKRRQPGAITQYPGFSAEVLERIPDFGRATVVLELFAGMGGGIAGFLSSGGVCSKLIAVEASLTARAAYWHHCAILSQAYPAQFPPSAWADVFGEGTHDVRFLNWAAAAAPPHLTTCMAR
eukprot:jgi/Mesvir1/20069/Mv13320-RA.1